MAAAHEELQVSVDSGSLTAEISGSGFPILLIDGQAPQLWGALPGRLASECRVITYQRRGYGSARAGKAPDLSTHARDAAAVLQVAGGPAVLLGWSLGGVIAMEVATERPELVRGLVLLEPPLHVKKYATPGTLVALGGAILLGKIGRHEAGARRFLRWALRRRDGGSDLQRMAAGWLARLAGPDGRAVVAELELGTGEHLDAAQLRKIATPTIVVRGDRTNPALAAGAQRAADMIRRAELIEAAGSGHAVQLDALDIVLTSIAGVSRSAMAPQP